MIRKRNGLLFEKWRFILIAGYVVSSTWVATTAAFAFYAFTMPVPQPLVMVPRLNESHVDRGFPVVASIVFDEALNPRDPFAKGPMQSVTMPRQESPSGIVVKAIILSVKNGVVLEDSSGGVYFLSEGESVNGIKVNYITKTTVGVEVQGNKMDLSI